MPYKNRDKQLAYQRKHYQDNKQVYRDRFNKRRKERKKWFYEFLKNKRCSICGESDRVCLDFHHKNPSKKDSAVTKLVNEMRSKKKVLSEIKKCIILCSNCHRKLHAGGISLTGKTLIK